MFVKYTQGDLRKIRKYRHIWDNGKNIKKEDIEKDEKARKIVERIKMNNENMQQVLDIAKERKISKQKMKKVMKDFAEENTVLYFLLNAHFFPGTARRVKTKLYL